MLENTAVATPCYRIPPLLQHPYLRSAAQVSAALEYPFVVVFAAWPEDCVGEESPTVDFWVLRNAKKARRRGGAPSSFCRDGSGVV